MFYTQEKQGEGKRLVIFAFFVTLQGQRVNDGFVCFSDMRINDADCWAR